MKYSFTYIKEMLQQWYKKQQITHFILKLKTIFNLANIAVSCVCCLAAFVVL